MSSMIYELAMVVDCGTYWRVTNVTKNTFDNLVNNDEKLLKLSHVSYKKIEEALLANKTVHINKNMMANEVLPFEVNVKDTSLEDPLQESKNHNLAKVSTLESKNFDGDQDQVVKMCCSSCIVTTHFKICLSRSLD